MDVKLQSGISMSYQAVNNTVHRLNCLSLFSFFLSVLEMVESSNLVTFTGITNSSGYDTFLMDEERGRLLVGAEDHIFSLDLVNINRDIKQVIRTHTHTLCLITDNLIVLAFVFSFISSGLYFIQAFGIPKSQ